MTPTIFGTHDDNTLAQLADVASLDALETKCSGGYAEEMAPLFAAVRAALTE